MLICICLTAQHKNDNWIFGDSAAVNFINLNVPSPFKSASQSRGSCSSISDSIGNLI